MRASQFVAESRGMFGRKKGDLYINDNGQTATFNHAEMFPNTKTNDAYKDHPTALIEINRIEAREGSKISWVNAEKQNTNAFAIVYMDSDDGSKMLWGRWYNVVPANVDSTWKNDQLPQGWVWSSKTATKAKSGMTPQDLIKTEKAFNSSEELLQTILNNGASPEIMEGLQMVSAGSKVVVFKGLGDKLTSVRDHLGEIITPLALISEVINDTNAINAKKDILKTEYSSCAIRFPQNKNNNLVDSEFIAPSGEILGISTKGNKGADASIINIWNAMNKQENAPLAKKYKYAVDVVRIIADNGQKLGPLVLGEQLGIIDKYLKDEILHHIDNKTNKPEEMSENAQRLFIAYKSESDTPGFNIGYVLLANCAKKVAEEINKDKRFEEACRAFLNQASIIQVYTDAKASGNDVQITGFRSVYPPKFEGSIKLEAGKTYMSTGIKGKFVFKIGKG
jgi:hypothetical protein